MCSPEILGALTEAKIKESDGDLARLKREIMLLGQSGVLIRAVSLTKSEETIHYTINVSVFAREKEIMTKSTFEKEGRVAVSSCHIPRAATATG